MTNVHQTLDFLVPSNHDFLPKCLHQRVRVCLSLARSGFIDLLQGLANQDWRIFLVTPIIYLIDTLLKVRSRLVDQTSAHSTCVTTHYGHAM